MVSRTDFDIYLLTDRGKIVPQSYDCVIKLIPGENFSIVVTNNSHLKTKTKFYLSGTNIGTLVIPKFERCELKRPIRGPDRCFTYCEFGTSIAQKAKLNVDTPHSDELTVIFYPEYIPEKNYSNPKTAYAAASASINGRPISEPDGINHYKSLKVESDYGGCGGSGGAILGAAKTNQKFFETSDFVTRGKYSFTLVFRSLETNRLPTIIPLSEMYKFSL